MGNRNKNALLFFICLCGFSLTTNAQNGMAGKEFWLGFTKSYDGSSNTVIYVYSNTPTSGAVTVPFHNFTQNFNLSAGGRDSIFIPSQFAISLSPGKGNKAIYIWANDSIFVTAANYQYALYDASNILPEQLLRTDYYTLIHNSEIQNPSEVLIVALYDNTSIEIVPSVKTLNGLTPGQPNNIYLNRGETYLLQSEAMGDLSGTMVFGKGNCYPFAVFAGVACANIPAGCGACDNLFHQLYPADFFGRNHFLTPVNGPYTIRIIAIEDETTLRINEGIPINLNKGQFYSKNHNTESMFISSNGPVMVAQYLQGTSCSNSGDPAMAIISPFEQKTEKAYFNTINTGGFKLHKVNIVIETSNANSVFLDGVNVGGGFTPFTSAPAYAYKQIEIKPGGHLISAAGGFTANVYGIGEYISYFYSTGIKGLDYKESINDFSFTEPLCAGIPINYNANGNCVNCKWYLGDGNSGNGGNIHHTYNYPNIYEVRLIPPQPNKYCNIAGPDTIVKQIEVLEAPVFKIFTDTTLCGSNSEIKIDLEGKADKFVWSTGTSGPAINIKNEGTYWLMSSIGDCSRVDTFKIKKSEFPTINFATKSIAICPSDSVTINPETNPDARYEWPNGSTGKSLTVYDEGIYHLQIENNCGVARDSVSITFLAKPAFTLSPDTTILLGTFSTLQAKGGNSYAWYPTYGLSCFNCPNPIASPGKTTKYYVETTGINGCTALDSVTVMVDTDLHVYIPNIFSPNGDGQNDIFYVRGKGIRNFQFTIYNRWGEKVFETSDLYQGWDGTLNGKQLSPAVFVYTIDAIMESGQRIVKKGDLTLLR